MEGKRFVELNKDEDFPHELDPLDGELDAGLPSTEDVILKTEQVTKNIQELLRAAQESKHDRWGWGTATGSLWTPLLPGAAFTWGHPCHPMVGSRHLPPRSPPLLVPSFVPCSEKIHSAVTEMASLFPKVGGVLVPYQAL